MDKKMMWKLCWAGVKEYLPSLKSPLPAEKAPPTMEYVTILAAGALFGNDCGELF